MGFDHWSLFGANGKEVPQNIVEALPAVNLWCCADGSRCDFRWPIILDVATRVNYEDNLFFLHSLIKGVRGGFQLELDEDYFRDKIVEDIFFVDRTLQQIYETLRVNSYLINRRSHLRDLMRVKRSFADLLADLVDLRLPWASSIAAFSDKLATARTQHVRDIADIQGLMEGSGPEEEPRDIVSQDEYRFLFESGEQDDTE